MDLSPGQQKAVFAAVVVVLAGLGIYLLATPHGNNQPSASKSPTPSAASSTPAQAAGSPSAAPAPQPSASGNVNVYQWLPFNQQALGHAAAVATQVTRDYNTFTYTEDATAYLAPMNGLITTQLSQTLAAHELCPNIRPYRKRHYVQPGVGHYGVFNGRRWTTQIYPLLRNFILAND